MFDPISPSYPDTTTPTPATRRQLARVINADIGLMLYSALHSLLVFWGLATSLKFILHPEIRWCHTPCKSLTVLLGELREIRSVNRLT